MNKLRFGIMCGGPMLQAWQRNCIEHMDRAGVAEPVCLIIENKSAATPPRRKSLALRLLDKFRRLMDAETRRGALWTLYMRRYHGRGLATREIDCRDLLGGLERIECKINRQGKYSEIFDAASIAGIKALGLDFIVKFAFGIIRGGILDAARHGVWSYHHGDERLIRGSPTCFWEIYHQHPTTGGILQRLTEALDAGVILHRGTFKTNPSYIKHRDHVLFASADWCARVCRDIILGDLSRVKSPPSNSNAAIHRIPGNLQMLFFALLKVRNVLAGQFKKHFTYDVWNVGTLETTQAELLKGGELTGVRWVAAHDKYHFIADPFPSSEGEQASVLVEEFDYLRSAKGRLRKLRLPEATAKLELETVTISEVHMSYPFLIDYEGERYCVPETHESGKVMLFRRTGPDDFVFKKILVGNVAASDPTVFHHNNFWWLFFTDESDGGSLKLKAYYARDLMGDWLPHPLNPLKCDITSARPAGAPFTVNGGLYRPAQDCSLSYGGSIRICHIKELTPTAFSEQVVAHLKPDPHGPYPDGTHTLNWLGEVCLLDGKKVVFDPAWVFRRRRYERLARARSRPL